MVRGKSEWDINTAREQIEHDPEYISWETSEISCKDTEHMQIIHPGVVLPQGLRKKNVG